MKTVTVELEAGPGGFTDDKDEAKRIRVDTIIPALEANKRIVLDFSRVKSSTQSFVHALLGEVLQRYKGVALEKIEFRRCNPLMKSLVELVVDYSLGGFRTESDSSDEEQGTPTPKRATRRKSKRRRS